MQLLFDHLSQITGKSLKNAQLKPVYGGSINQSYHLKADNNSWFIKLNVLELESMFRAEAKGLSELATTKTINVPKVILCGNDGRHAYLILEYIHLNAFNKNSEIQLGQQLAQLHRQQHPRYGWHLDNTIGSTPQHNQWDHDWVSFWQQQRLAKQLQFLAEKGYTGKFLTQGDTLCADVGLFFNTYSPQASLVHGDLWSGNVAVNEDNAPVIFDPACYYADREVDIAMTELFAGFGCNFYRAYQNEWPLDEGYPIRKILYNLYHILNHLNLFRDGYQKQAERMINQLLAEI
ncbi:MAG: fructosamine kinase family protein [Methylococcales bacterium]|nr:fructosamine kinase family protein [Methylococcales bacterium]